jgi:hypothetical protein
LAQARSRPMLTMPDKVLCHLLGNSGEAIGSIQQPNYWEHLTSQQLGRYAEYFVKMQFVLRGFEVYSSEVDDRGIDFVLRYEPGHYWDVQVKSILRSEYLYMKKDKFCIRKNLLIALVLFVNGREPDLFLIPAARWESPDGMFVDNDYEGLKSVPEYGLRLSRRWREKLAAFDFNMQLTNIVKDTIGSAAI